jgi:hypothetical protein
MMVMMGQGKGRLWKVKRIKSIAKEVQLSLTALKIEAYNFW